MSRTKRKGDGPTPGVRNDSTGRIGTTRHRKADRNKKTPETWEEALAMGWDSDDWHDLILQQAYEDGDY